MISKIKHSMIISLIFFIVSCQSKTIDSATCSSLVSDIPSERLNIDLILSTPYNKKDYTIQEDLRFLADNYSKDTLEIIPDKDLEVYLWSSSGWIKIKNNLDYLSRVDRIGAKNSDDPGRQIYRVFYNTSQIQAPTRFCITLRAIKDPKNTHMAVASYLEIKISP